MAVQIFTCLIWSVLLLTGLSNAFFYLYQMKTRKYIPMVTLYLSSIISIICMISLSIRFQMSDNYVVPLDIIIAREGQRNFTNMFFVSFICLTFELAIKLALLRL